MPTREDMNSAGQPFLGLRCQDPASMQPDDPTWARLRQRVAELEQAVSQLQRLVSEGCAKREAQAREISGWQESASALRRDLAQARELLNEMQTVAIEWQSVAEDRQKQVEALREELRIDRDTRRRYRQVTKAERDACDAVELLRPAIKVKVPSCPQPLAPEKRRQGDGPNIPLGPDGGHARNCACVHCTEAAGYGVGEIEGVRLIDVGARQQGKSHAMDELRRAFGGNAVRVDVAPQEMTATEVRRRLEAVACPPVRADPWDTFGVEALEKMLTARERRVQVPGAVLINPDGSTERVQPVDLVVTVDPAKPGDDMTVMLRPHTFNSFTRICEACGLTEDEAMHPGAVQGCAG